MHFYTFYHFDTRTLVTGRNSALDKLTMFELKYANTASLKSCNTGGNLPDLYYIWTLHIVICSFEVSQEATLRLNSDNHCNRSTTTRSSNVPTFCSVKLKELLASAI